MRICRQKREYLGGRKPELVMSKSSKEWNCEMKVCEVIVEGLKMDTVYTFAIGDPIDKERREPDTKRHIRYVELSLVF